MSLLRAVAAWVSVFAFAASGPAMLGQAAASGATAEQHGAPGLLQRPAPGPEAGYRQLDVLVTGPDGAPVGGLTAQDFALFDNGEPRPILSFHAMNLKDDPPPAELILVLDETNNALHNVAFERNAIAQFLRQKNGRLGEPTTVMLFTEHGVQTEPHPLTDGNALADHLDKVAPTTHMIPMGGGYDAIQRLQKSLQALNLIAMAEASKPGRKLLVWIGPGWPLLDSSGYRESDRSQRGEFNSLVELTRRLQEARITLYGVNAADPGSGALFLRDRYKSFLKPVLSPQNMNTANMSTPVFALHSGGLTLNTAADLVALLNRCAAEAGPYYTISFDPTPGDHVDEYHSLTVTIHKPGLTARTWAGYYAEPTLAKAGEGASGGSSH